MAFCALIAAVASNGVIGHEGGLAWKIPGELAYFKAATMGSPLVMGRKTWESLPVRPLKGRANIVVTRNQSYATDIEKAGAIAFLSCDEAHDHAAKLADSLPEKLFFNIGGGEIFKAALPKADLLYLTEIDSEPAGDTFFPPYNRDEFTLVKEKAGVQSDSTVPAHRFCIYKRIAS